MLPLDIRILSKKVFQILFAVNIPWFLFQEYPAGMKFKSSE